MSIFKQQLSKNTKTQAAVVSTIVLLVIVLVALDFIFNGPITQLLTNRDEVVATVEAWGFFGPLLFIIMQIAQTIIAPIPGGIMGAVGGFLFGWLGILWTTIGSFFGFWIVFLLSRKFGRGLIEKIIKKESLAKFDHLSEEKGSAVIFLLFLIPVFPDSVAGYSAGFTNIPIRKLLAIAIISRTPAVVAVNMFGAGLGQENVTQVVTISVIFVIACIIAAAKHDAIMKYLNSSHEPKK